MIYRFGPLVVYGDRRTLYRDGQMLHVAPKSVELLLLFAERAGDLVNRETIRERVWKNQNVHETNINRQISLLRSILTEHLGEGQHLHTVSKRGYQLTSIVTIEEESAATTSGPPAVIAPDGGRSRLLVAHSMEDARSAARRDSLPHRLAGASWGFLRGIGRRAR